MITKVVVGFTALIKGLSTWADLTEPETYEVWNVGGRGQEPMLSTRLRLKQHTWTVRCIHQLYF